MAAFAYRAVDAAGKSQKGVIEATSAAGARRQLRERALLPVSVEATGARADAVRQAAGGISWFRPRVSARQLSTATRQMATLIGSDISVEEALRLVADQAETTRMRSVLLEMRGSILDGRSLSSAMSEQPQAFPDYYRASIAAGEQSGMLGEVLGHLADFVESRHRAQSKVQMALLYPALLATVSLSMMVLLMVYVVPDIVRVFESRGADLPFLTRALIGLSHFIRSFGWIVAVLLVVAVIGGQRWLRVPANRLAFDREVATRRPTARLVRQFAAARFAATLGQLVQSAVPLVEALGAAAATTSNSYVRAQALSVAAKVREGGSLSQAMAQAGVFPAMLIAIVASGEASGRLGPALSRAAGELDRELDALITVVVGLVEPAVLLLMGGVVLMMVLAILLPIVNLNNLVAA
ncbi:type II secretion system inner membrane protein GspF [Sphingomonas sp. BIUV-7]|uniref:General secretion pathway protein F n=1 Tax=Sphingomonas natans TaxID=3063330 RepID=A0ABT8Y5K8_9SPHN|nr:type II secretion system inner membrane protein GspF [Sphingomonas sp. BIUV-7]MDO6413606.1 type II secretion system inner membrane protein GspF [Sphingomonas sp. BIUV-7]